MPETLDASLARILTADGRVVGTGLLVGERQVFTCAHVLNQALGLPDQSIKHLQEPVSLDFPRLSHRPSFATKILLWCPPSPDGSGDIAGSELEGDPPTGGEVVGFAQAEDVWKHLFNVLGFPDGQNCPNLPGPS